MISAQEFQRRRGRLMAKLPAGSAAVIPGGKEKLRNGDTMFPFRQDSNFYYLTGFNEPDAIALLLPGNNKGAYVLFNRPRDSKKETWDGPRIGQEGAKEVYNADQAYSIAQVDELIPKLLSSYQRLYCPLKTSIEFENRLQHWIADGGPDELVDLGQLLSIQRLIKSRAEIETIRKAVEISCQAHLRALRACFAGMVEYELEAELVYEFLRQGADAAYPPIVAGGANACILHYQAKQALLKKNELILIDAAAEYQNYGADITRTFPISGRFSNPQKQVYEIVLQAQQAVIDIIKPGITWDKLQQTAVREITQGLMDVSILTGELKELIEKKAYFPFYMHGVSHWLGLDTHDVGSYKQDKKWQTLQPGMVLTVEPGIYIKAGQENIEKKWWDIGVRIEDDVLVTEKGCEVLSASLPKTIPDIERIRN